MPKIRTHSLQLHRKCPILQIESKNYLRSATYPIRTTENRTYAQATSGKTDKTSQRGPSELRNLESKLEQTLLVNLSNRLEQMILSKLENIILNKISELFEKLIPSLTDKLNNKITNNLNFLSATPSQSNTPYKTSSNPPPTPKYKKSPQQNSKPQSNQPRESSTQSTAQSNQEPKQLSNRKSTISIVQKSQHINETNRSHHGR
jgi:hypothetical protein